MALVGVSAKPTKAVRLVSVLVAAVRARCCVIVSVCILCVRQTRVVVVGGVALGKSSVVLVSAHRVVPMVSSHVGMVALIL